MHACFVIFFLDDALVKEHYVCLDSDMLRIRDNNVSHEGFVRVLIYFTGGALSTTHLTLTM